MEDAMDDPVDFKTELAELIKKHLASTRCRKDVLRLVAALDQAAVKLDRERLVRLPETG
jgi:hypothetical protein